MMLSVEFVVVTCGTKSDGGCNVTLAMSRTTYEETKRTGRTWYCPNGHPRVWGGPTTEQRLRDAEARQVHLGDQLRAAEVAAEKARVEAARLLQRAANGVCPCCNRSFENLRRHVETQHPDLAAEQRGSLGKRVVFRCSCYAEFATLHGLRTHQGKMRDEGWTNPKVSEWDRHLTVTT
jgi:hypothetical protein